MTSRDSTQVRPAETDAWEQGKEKKEKKLIYLKYWKTDTRMKGLINLFYLLLCCFISIAFHVQFMILQARKDIPPSKDLFEHFNAWGLKKIPVIDNRYSLEITIQIGFNYVQHLSNCSVNMVCYILRCKCTNICIDCCFKCLFVVVYTKQRWITYIR